VKVAKVDIDLILDDDLRHKFIKTRKAIIHYLGYTFVAYREKDTEHGFHFWFTVAEDLTARELAELQFLLGDDVKRCAFNFLRESAGVFNHFNALFSEKLKGVNKDVGKDGKV